MDYGKVAFFLVLAVALGVGIWMLCKQAGSKREQAPIIKVQNTAHCVSGTGKGGVCQDGDIEQPINMVRGSGSGCMSVEEQECLEIEPWMYSQVNCEGDNEPKVDDSYFITTTKIATFDRDAQKFGGIASFNELRAAPQSGVDYVV